MPYTFISLVLFALFGWLCRIGFPFQHGPGFAHHAAGLFWGYLALGNIFLALLRVATDRFDLPAGNLFMHCDGTPRFLWRVLIWPYLRLERWAWKGYRKRGGEPLFSEVSESIFIGAHPRKSDRDQLRSLGINAILDVNCELLPAFRSESITVTDYLCVPAIDGSAPTLGQLELGVSWAAARLAEGRKVLVHCTFGHGRSAAFVAGLLVRRGAEPDIARGLARVKKLDRRIVLTRSQERAVGRFI